MADLGQILLTFPTDKQLQPAEYEREASRYAQRIAAITASEWAKGTAATNLFDVLDPQVNSLAYLYTLTYAISQSPATVQTTQRFLPNAQVFMETFDPIQTRFASSRWSALYSWTADAMISVQLKDFTLLAVALQRFTTDLSAFTLSHLTYVRACIRAQVPSISRLILDHDIYSIPDARKETYTPNGNSEDQLGESHSVLTPELILEYYLLGAQVYIGLTNWTRARLFLDYVLLYPASNHAISVYQVEAYKKLVLLGLLTHGGSPAALRTVDQINLKNIRAVSKPYDVLADTFKSRNWRKLQAEVDVGTNIWQEDGNARLVQAVANSIMLFCITDMQKTYTSVPLSTVAKHLRLGESETLAVVQSLLQQDRLKASIIPMNGANSAALRFRDSQEATQQSSFSTATQTARIEHLVQAIADADRRLQLTKEYLDFSRRAKRQTADNDPADQMDLEWNVPASRNPIGDEGDEDIMA